MTRILLGLHGKAGSGKDTFCRLLKELHPFQRMAFADPLKDAAGPLFGLPREKLFDDDFKGFYHHHWNLTIREIYQKLGTEAMRGTFGDNFWIRRWEWEYIRTAGDVVVTDVRFENEATKIRDMGGRIVHIVRPDRQAMDERAEAHASEAGIEVQVGDTVIHNDSTLDTLALKAADLVRGLQ